MLAQARPQPHDEREEHGEVPQRLVEERRMEILVLRDARRPMSRRDVELPRHVGRPAERFFVEEVPPASDRLAEDHALGRDVEPAQDRQSLVPREDGADERPHDQAAVHRQPALPYRGNLRQVLAVVVPVEDDLVCARAQESREDRPLPRVDDVVGRQALAPRLPMCPPESHDDRGGHEDAVPAHGKRPDAEDLGDLERDGARRGEHDGLR